MADTMRDKLNEALKEAMRSKDQRAISTLRLILAALKDRDIASRGKSADGRITDDEILQMLQSMVKQREDSIAMYEQGGRLELAEQEQAEIDILEKYLPAQLTESELDALIDEVIAATGAESIRDMGKVMAAIKSQAAGKADMGAVSGRVKARLGA